MKHYILIAVTSGLLMNDLSITDRDKKHDLFYKADMKCREKRCPYSARVIVKKQHCRYSDEV